MHAWERWLSDSVEHTGQQYREYLAARKAGAARRLLPQTARGWTGAMYSATDGVAGPQLAGPAIAPLAGGGGAQVF